MGKQTVMAPNYFTKNTTKTTPLMRIYVSDVFEPNIILYKVSLIINFILKEIHFHAKTTFVAR